MHKLVPLLMIACTGPASPEPLDIPSCDANSPQAGTVEFFAHGFERGVVGTEGLSFSPDGRLFVGGAGYTGEGFVAEIQPDGDWEILVDVPGSIGLTWWGDRLLVATPDVGDETAGIIAVDPDARTTEVFARGLPGANFMAVTPWDTLLMSYPSGTELLEIEPDGSWSVWATDVPSPNGITFSLDGATAYVANTYSAPSTVAKIAVEDGEAVSVDVLATLPDGSTQDGVALDIDGSVYVVNNLPGTISRIRWDGEITELAQSVSYGASMAFGEGEFDPCSLYVTSLFSDRVFRVGAGIEGHVPYR